MNNLPQYGTYNKYLRIDLDMSEVTSILEENSLFDNVILVDNDNNIIASANTYHEYGLYDTFSKSNLNSGIVAMDKQLKTVPLTIYGYYDSKIVSEEFKKMRFKTLLEEEYNSKIIKAKLERETIQSKLLALQSQVNPHFLFNALECIRLKSVAKDENETAKIILYMSRMFRNLINWKEDIIPLSEEVKFLKEFLNIQKYRFEDEFIYRIKIDKNTNSCLIPKFIIQPLVENACIHGIGALVDYRHVRITSILKDGRLCISVMDNGIGIEDKKLELIKSNLEKKDISNNNIGLNNIYQRLYLYYNSEFSFNIYSKEKIGTKITLKIPIYNKKKEFCVFNSNC
jgi:sensor histidine kinase YesM